jgi:hypothetical protein
LNPALGPASVDDGVLNGFDANGFAVEVQRTSSLTGGWANTAGELWKIVGRMQRIQGLSPLVSVDQVVEVRNDVVDWAAVVTKRNATVHASSRLLMGLLRAESNDKLFVVLEPLAGILIALFQPLEFHKSSDFSHVLSC